MNRPQHQLTNEQWAIALDLLSEMIDGADPGAILSGQSDATIRAALESLWAQHEVAERVHFLEEQITIVSELSAAAVVREVFQPGQILANRFAILRTLGRGGMGEVYLADDQRLMETVALKTIKRDLAASQDNRARFLSEVQSSRRVTHANVCRIFDLFEHDGVQFLSMEYVAGPTLAEVLAAGRRLKLERARPIATQVAEGLWTAHRNGILHCDFKPANIILTGSGKQERAVITDFGLARALGGGAELTSASIAGTPPYMAPELLRGGQPSVRTDIFAFGKVLEALLPGHKLAAVCMDPDPGRRPASMEPIVKELRGTSTRRYWAGGVLLGVAAAGSSAYVYEQSRPKLTLGSRQRVRVNGFRPKSIGASQTVRNLLIMALRQSPLLSIPGDRTHRTVSGAEVPEAGLVLPVPDLLAKARAQNAKLAIDGTLDATARGLRLLIQVYDSTGSTPIYSNEAAVSDPRGLILLVERAANHLREAFGESGLHATYMPLDQITSSSPEALDCYFRAVSFYEASKAAETLALLDQAIGIDPKFVLAHHYRALALGAKRMLESAQTAAEIAYAQRQRVTERERNWIEGLYFNLIGAFEESAAAMQKNTALFPDEAVFRRQFAFALMRLGRYEEAIPHSREAFNLDPFSGNNAGEWLVNLAEANQLDECFAEADKIRAAGGAPRIIHRGLALAYMQKGKYEQSLAECQMLGLDSADLESWSRVISLPPLVVSGRFEDAIQMIKGDLGRDSTRPGAQREESRIYVRRIVLGQLYRLKDQHGLAREQAELLVHLPARPANLLDLREGLSLAFDLNDGKLAEIGVRSLEQIARRWPSSHSQGAHWLAQAMLNDAEGRDGAAAELLDTAKATWPDPITLLYAARSEGKRGNLAAQLKSLDDLERLNGKIYKHHFPGMAVLGWLEKAICLRKMSRLPESLRMYQRVVQHWGHPQAAGPLMRQTLRELDELQRRLK